MVTFGLSALSLDAATHRLGRLLLLPPKPRELLRLRLLSLYGLPRQAHITWWWNTAPTALKMATKAAGATTPTKRAEEGASASAGTPGKRVATGAAADAARVRLAELTKAKLAEGGEEAFAASLTPQFLALLSDGDASLASFLAAIGVANHPTQTTRRETVLETKGGRALLTQLETKLKDKPFLTATATAGAEEQPTQADASLVWAVRDVFDSVLEESDRIYDFPRVHRWLGRCLEHDAFVSSLREYMDSLAALDRAIPTRVLRGKERQGGMIDVKASSLDARRAADVVKRINADYKKKETQRQKEEKAKAAAEAAAAAAGAGAGSGTGTADDALPPFSLGDKIPSDGLDADEKTKRCVAMLNAVVPRTASDGEYRVVDHEAADDAAVLVRVLEAQKLGGVPCKNLFLKAKKPRSDTDSCLWLVCCPTSATVDLKALQATLGYKDQLRFADADTLVKSLDIRPGHVTPFALVNDPAGKVNVVLDSGMMADPNTTLWFHPLVNTKSLGISAQQLAKFVRASGRKAHLVPLSAASSSAAAAATVPSPVPSSPPASPATAPPPASPAAEPAQQQQQQPLSVTHSHDAARARVWARLAEMGVAAPTKQPTDADDQKRPRGHGTHNLFVKDKKKQLFMVTLRADRNVDLKTVGEKLGAKELRFAGPADVETAIGSTKGCITPLWLFNNVQKTVQLAVDAALLAAPHTSVVVCAGCDDAKDHAQHNVVEVTVAQLLALAKDAGLPEPVSLALE